MNRLPSLVRKHKELYNVGTEIIHTHNMIAHYRDVNTPWKLKGMKEHNLKLMKMYAKMSEEQNKEWGIFGPIITKYWKGQVSMK
jgi:hypothetical protein